MIKIFLLFSLFCALEAKQLPRTVISLYDSEYDEDVWNSPSHQVAEMPLNHLGLVVEHHNLQEGLPDLSKRDDVLGVLSWFSKFYILNDPEGYIDWVITQVDQGKKFVSLGPLAIENEQSPPPEHKVQKFLSLLGLKDLGSWVGNTYDMNFTVYDTSMMGFERNFIGIKDPFLALEPIGDKIKVYLATEYDGKTSALVSINPNGGYAAEGYEIEKKFQDDEHFRKWFINPFKFFNLAFELQEYPKPDNTTLNGRRIYYSHIDGDGWNNRTELEGYRRENTLSSEVILEEIIKPNEDLPVTVAPIGADIDLKWVGKEKSRFIARELFKLPQVEVGCHTMSHPFDWGFFKNYTPQKEEPFLANYPLGGWKTRSFLDHLFSFKMEKTELKQGYDLPRAYANFPFSLESEVDQAIVLVNDLCPENKHVKIYQWSGNCAPFKAAIQKTRKNGVLNINGGDNRFDQEFLSFSWIKPVGKKVGGELQIYASASNENTYTDLWTDRYYAFKMLVKTFINTEKPMRLTPLNIYYHMYSGEKLASLEALKSNFEFVKKKQIIPIETSLYAEIAEGFFATKIAKLGQDRFQILNRGKLNTIRFDKSSLKQIDEMKCEGVIGQCYLHGSLYVFLDPSVEEPVIVLREEHETRSPFLVESRWQVWDVKKTEDKITFYAKGYGPCEMRWQVPENEKWRMKTFVSQEGELVFSFGKTAYEPLLITLERYE